ncbi:glutathione S-transferase [Vineibacter terrae]|uniref:Glutathione S-transferase n=2 Tax=Vineibacter terrae TaxID=2586908 RepID=A0A5C8PKT6_9HYPH|nr:glutathione S-transferase [Vineibacter terrae]TXL74508.1 glutathione S-transferase [Vineibacter terrae]
MKLMYSPTSPYVRKVMVLAIEAGLDKKIDKETVATTPVAPNRDLAKTNPLVKVPSLRAEGLSLYDSPVICEYLDSKHRKKKFFPAKGKARFNALRQQALGDGLLDAALLVRYELTLREEPMRNAAWQEAQMKKIRSALDQMEKEAGTLRGSPTIGHITFACALAYLDFRFADEGWRKGHKKLAAWYDKFAQRPSMKATMPPT